VVKATRAALFWLSGIEHMSKTSDIATFGRYSELPFEKMTADQKKAYDFTVKERGQVPGPYKIWLQNSKLMEVMVPLGVYFRRHSSLSKSEIEIATNLTNVQWLAAYSNYEHEMIAEKAGGLPPEKVQALIAGLPTSFEDPRQQVVYEIMSALISPRVIPTGLYQSAVSLLGNAGLTDLTVLIGYFTCVSLTLMAYDVPSSAIGLDR
jgi:4-carboxymuconolactone decarboxylase